MNAPFFFMALGVFFTAAFTLAALVGVCLRWVGRRAEHLSHRTQGLLWMSLAAAPAIAGITALLAALLPSFGLAEDHCLIHASHHPHLCLHHPQPLSVPAAVVAVLGMARLASVFLREGRAALRMIRTAASLDSVAKVVAGLRVLPGRLPAAFVLGAVRSSIYVSDALLRMPPNVFGPAVAHERCHADRRHLLVRLIGRLLSALHAPWVASALDAKLATSQEVEADAYAARTLGDGVVVAESLLALSRARMGAPAGSLGFTDARLEERVVKLLEPQKSKPAWLVASLALAATVAIVLTIGSPAAVHHAFETALGWPH